MNQSLRTQSRVQILAAFGASDAVAAELAAYNGPPEWDEQALTRFLQAGLPLSSEASVTIWREWAEQAHDQGVWPVLRSCLPQLAFPIAAGMSQDPDYRAATLRGQPVTELAGAEGLILRSPETLTLHLHQGLGGAVPVITAPDRHDFTCLVRALAKRNEPKPLPDSMGAIMISGLANWARIHRFRENWEARHPDGDFADTGMPEMLQDKAHYCDRLIILGESPYSNVPADQLTLMGEPLDQADWLRRSRLLRLEHEATHYAVLRLLGFMRTNLHDELLADFMGICAAAGSFQPTWFLTFLGLERAPVYREGGRFQNYCADLSQAARAVLAALVVSAAEQVARFDRAENGGWDGAFGRATTLLSMAVHSLEEIAAPDGAERLAAKKKTFDVLLRNPSPCPV
ncbi:DUF7005 family protein [Acanthopleuribacter pedis]|uniref:Uncharacterized protein n=1 Tax=Acanthopleuribacter pedis TaxID=442870 RepID=A0A8J7QBU3_9BACT|nr:hypothetical protein [Acanthopleuribacter pedis]MBO1323242.1 hypothetical protein [Acanthopleuribacter pedis]